MSVEKIVTGTLAERDAKINANFEALDTDKLGKTETAADSSKLGGVAAASYAKTADMNSAIEAAKSAVKDELIDGAPGAYDTLKEIADYIAEDKTGAAAMNEAIAGKLGKTETAAAAAKLTTSAGSTTQPVYFDDGVPKACTYKLNKTVPADAVFTDTVYTLPTASASVLGGVKTGSNITNSSGTISITKANVVAALGYTPPTSASTVTKTEFTASSANWGSLSNGYYPFTLAASGKHFLGMYRTNSSTYESVMVDVVESSSNIIIRSTEKFAGFVLTI